MNTAVLEKVELHRSHSGKRPCYHSKPAVCYSVYAEGKLEADKYKWIESQKAQRDLGAEAIHDWVERHWNGYLRNCWVEHLQGTRYWIELDREDFGLLNHEFQDDLILLDRIFDRLKMGWENLEIIQWSMCWDLPMNRVLNILEALDINSRRLSCQFLHHP